MMQFMCLLYYVVAINLVDFIAELAMIWHGPACQDVSKIHARD